MQPENNLKSHLWPCPAAVLLNLKQKKKKEKKKSQTNENRQAKAVHPANDSNKPS